MENSKIYEVKETDQLIHKLADAIVESMFNTPEESRKIGIIGIQAKGVPLAHELARIITEKIKITPPVGTLDITMYRDDLGSKKLLPQICETHIPFDIENKTILLVDEICHTGRTVRAALDAITYYGRPKIIRLATLIDRGNNELPIRPDFVGETVQITKDEWISMEKNEDNQIIIKISKR